MCCFWKAARILLAISSRVVPGGSGPCAGRSSNVKAIFGDPEGDECAVCAETAPTANKMSTMVKTSVPQGRAGAANLLRMKRFKVCMVFWQARYQSQQRFNQKINSSNVNFSHCHSTFQ